MTFQSDLHGPYAHAGKLTEPLKVKLSKEDKESLDRLAAERGISPGTLARWIIAAWVAEQERRPSSLRPEPLKELKG